MILFAIAAAVTAHAPQTNVPEFIWDDVYASGYTKQVKVKSVTFKKVVQTKNKKRVIAFIPKADPLAEIIARVKRENGIDRKNKS